MTHVRRTCYLILVISVIEVTVAVKGSAEGTISWLASRTAYRLVTVEQIRQRDPSIIHKILNGMNNAAEGQTVPQVMPLILPIAVSKAATHQQVRVRHLMNETSHERELCRGAHEAAVQRDDDLTIKAA